MKVLMLLLTGLSIILISYLLKLDKEANQVFPPPLKSLLIEYKDGTTEVVQGDSPKSMKDGTLYFYQNGERKERHDLKRWEKR